MRPALLQLLPCLNANFECLCPIPPTPLSTVLTLCMSHVSHIPQCVIKLLEHDRILLAVFNEHSVDHFFGGFCTLLFECLLRLPSMVFSKVLTVDLILNVKEMVHFFQQAIFFHSILIHTGNEVSHNHFRFLGSFRATQVDTPMPSAKRGGIL